MRCLEWIVAANQVDSVPIGPSALGWEVKLESELMDNSLACPGIVHVFNTISGEHFTVNVSNPHDETELVAFHRNPVFADSIKARVEAIASQRRRMLIRAA